MEIPSDLYQGHFIWTIEWIFRFIPSLSTPVLSTPASSTVISSTQHFAVISHTLLKFNAQFNVLGKILAIYRQIYNFPNPTQLLIYWVLVQKELSLVFSVFAWTHLNCGCNNPTCLKLQSMSVDVPWRNTPKTSTKACKTLVNQNLITMLHIEVKMMCRRNNSRRNWSRQNGSRRNRNRRTRMLSIFRIEVPVCQLMVDYWNSYSYYWIKIYSAL